MGGEHARTRAPRDTQAAKLSSDRQPSLLAGAEFQGALGLQGPAEMHNAAAADLYLGLNLSLLVDGPEGCPPAFLLYLQSAGLMGQTGLFLVHDL